MLAADGVRALPYHAGMEKEEREAHQNIFMTDPGRGHRRHPSPSAWGSTRRTCATSSTPTCRAASRPTTRRSAGPGATARPPRRTCSTVSPTSGCGGSSSRRRTRGLSASAGSTSGSTRFWAFARRRPAGRVALLDYFGEQTGACGNCDCCLDPSERLDGTEDAQKILSTVQHSGERFGAAHVIDILRGTETEKIVRFGHGRLPTFGTLAQVGARNEWRSLIRQMVATGFLRLDIAGYGGLGITDKGRGLLRGKGAFRYREDTVAARPSAVPPERRRKEPADTLTGDQTTLLGVLKVLRLELAKERGVPAYVVFHDRTLIDMARRRPRTKEEFAEVNGVGAAKLEQFASPFLAAIDGARSDAG